MKRFFLTIIAALFTVASHAQTIDFTYQGWSELNGTNNLSLYIAKDGFKLGSAFNDENYPVWYAENQPIDVNSGVVNYRITGVNLDSLSKYRGQLFLYVAINGTPHDTIAMDPSPYAGTSITSIRANTAEVADLATLANFAQYSDTAKFARNAAHAATSDSADHADNADRASRSDSATHARNSDQAVRSDVSLYASSSAHSVWSDSASYALLALRAANADRADFSDRSTLADSAINAAHAVHADNATHATTADSAYVSANTHFVYANGVNLASIDALGAENHATLTTNGTSLTWRSATRIEGRTQLTLVPLTTIDNDVRTLIYRVAQDFTSPLPAATEGRIITIVNSSTANVVSIQAGVWNIWGGDVFIGPRNSATLLYHNGQWVIIAQ
jgi:hypothetical protein